MTPSAIFSRVTARLRSLKFRRAKQIADSALQLGIMSFFALMVLGLFLFFGEMAWTIYRDTHIGETFTRSFPRQASYIQDVLDYSISDLALDAVFAVLGSGAKIFVLMQILHLNPALRKGRHLSGRLCFFALPLTAAAAWSLQCDYRFYTPVSAIVLTILPCLMMADAISLLAERLIPTAGSLFTTIRYFYGNVIHDHAARSLRAACEKAGILVPECLEDNTDEDGDSPPASKHSPQTYSPTMTESPDTGQRPVN